MGNDVSVSAVAALSGVSSLKHTLKTHLFIRAHFSERLFHRKTVDAQFKRTEIQQQTAVFEKPSTQK